MPEVYFDAESGNREIRRLRRVIRQVACLCFLRGTEKCNPDCPAWEFCEGEDDGREPILTTCPMHYPH